MMKIIFFASMLALVFSGCEKKAEDIKIGVSMGIGPASRWSREKMYMEQRAKELGIDIEVRLNTTDTPKTQEQDCFELVDSNIDVLIVIPRDIQKAGTIIEYAKEKKVKVISYARLILKKKYDLFVGYDSNRIGQLLGQYLTEMVYTGDYIILRGDSGDFNAELLYEGAMRYITPIKNNIRILADKEVPGWSPAEAKKIVLEAVKANGNTVDAILAPNDKIAGACAEALEELGITKPVAITGMDAEPEALRRIVAGKQDVTVYMNLKELAQTAINEAYHMASKQKINVNSNFENGTEGGVPANLIAGKIITRQNLDKILIDTGVFSRETIYGK